MLMAAPHVACAASPAEHICWTHAGQWPGEKQCSRVCCVSAPVPILRGYSRKICNINMQSKVKMHDKKIVSDTGGRVRSEITVFSPDLLDLEWRICETAGRASPKVLCRPCCKVTRHAMFEVPRSLSTDRSMGRQITTLRWRNKLSRLIAREFE
ncbi:hypothetical protein GGS26DRAFT_301665 [Hypomontagnella submonticulosa]|nr:hypothetical protein GGS26DRAFT_301665 [Hypomontagnella submonticulosa]